MTLTAIVPIRSFEALSRLADAVRELTQMTKLWTGRSFAFLEGYLILTGFYLTLTVSLSLLLRWYEKRIEVPGA
jgi:ABC-type amino acid transport system permease subunit